MLKDTLSTDKAGRHFLPFAVDVRFGADWKEDLVGCVYQGSGDLFVRVGDDYRPVAFLFGKKADPRPDVCREAAPRS